MTTIAKEGEALGELAVNSRGLKHTGASGNRDGNIGVDHGLAAGRDGGDLCGVEVVAGGEQAAAGRQASLVGELLDLERRAGLHGGGDGGVVGGGLDSLGGRIRLLLLCGDGFRRGHFELREMLGDVKTIE